MPLGLRARVLCARKWARSVSYVQGQSPTPRTREYFYFIDHQGQLFMDDAKLKNFVTCFKEEKFLEFFFKRVKFNRTGRYESEFPYVSPCGREMNYVRCDDLPVVFSHLLDSSRQVIQDMAAHGASTGQGTGLLSYGGAGHRLTVPFHPPSLCMLPGSGRVYHRGPEGAGGVGLVKSSLAIELSHFFLYNRGCPKEGSPPCGFRWGGSDWALDPAVLHRLQLLKQQIK